MSRRRFAVRGGVLLALVGTVFLVFAASAAAATVSVTPANGTAAVGQLYCVTATVSEGSGGYFEFTAAPTGSGGVATPNPPAATMTATGRQATFCLTSGTPGEVLITATARAFGISERPVGTATVTFVAFPTDKGQCKDGGWQAFGIFKNQGDCVSFVATGGKNPPTG